MIEINELFNEIITFDIPFICLVYISKEYIVHFYRKYTRTVCMHISISTKAIHATSYYSIYTTYTIKGRKSSTYHSNLIYHQI